MRLLFTGIVVLVWSTLILAAGAESAGTPDDVLPALLDKAGDLKAQKTTTDQALSDLDLLRVSEPKPTSHWQDLTIGEFEANPDFTKRREAARTAEVAEYQRALSDWRVKTSAAKTLGTTVTDTKANSVLFKYMPDNDRNPLPFFDRNSMSFKDVDLGFTKTNIPSASHKNVFGSFDTVGLEHYRIKADSMEIAERFKNDFTKGHTLVLVEATPILQEVESPIAVSGAIEVSNIRRPKSTPSATPVTKNTAVYKEGVCYHINLQMTEVYLVDREGSRISGVVLEPEPKN